MRPAANRPVTKMEGRPAGRPSTVNLCARLALERRRQYLVLLAGDVGRDLLHRLFTLPERREPLVELAVQIGKLGMQRPFAGIFDDGQWHGAPAALKANPRISS